MARRSRFRGIQYRTALGRIGNFVGKVEDRIVDFVENLYGKLSAQYKRLQADTDGCCLKSYFSKCCEKVSGVVPKLRSCFGEQNIRRRILLIVGTIFLSIIVFVLGLILLVRIGAFGKIPTSESLAHITNNEASLVFSSDGVLLGKYFDEDRSDVSLEQIPPSVIDALIATEDVRFMHHEGVDYRSLCRVFVKSLLLRDSNSGGGSTISQQLAKNLFGRQSHGVLSMPITKIKEITIASRLEKIYTKDEILTLYLNTVSFGENVYGIENASLRYFSKHSSELTLDEGAVLVGMLKANTFYNPHINPTNALQRRNVVLNLMARNGMITHSQCDSVCALPLGLKYKSSIDYDRENGYFVSYVRTEAEAIIENYNRLHNTQYDLLVDGLQIITTLDKKAQNIYLEANNKHLLRLQSELDAQLKKFGFWKKNKTVVENCLSEIVNVSDTAYPSIYPYGMSDSVMSMTTIDSIRYAISRLQSAVLAADPKTGAVRVWIGGSNYMFYPYNHVLAKRQVGSTFKPIVYYTALEQGLDPCRYFKNERKVYHDYDDWSPGNGDTIYNGYYSVRGALAGSINTVSAEVLFEAGIEPSIATAHKLGIVSQIPEVPSIVLGVADISLFEMVQAYSVFANKGRRNDLYVIQTIKDKDGKVLYEAPKPRNEQILDVEATEKLVSMLNDVINNGTGLRIRSSYKITGDIAGKTGTTQNNTDGWFIGFTPNWVMGVWVGCDNPIVRFQTTKSGQGANTSLPIWALGYEKMQRYKWGHKYAGNFTYSITPIDCAMWSETEPVSLSDIFEMLFEKDKIKEREERRQQRQERREQMQKRQDDNKSRGFLRELFGRSRRR